MQKSLNAVVTVGLATLLGGCAAGEAQLGEEPAMQEVVVRARDFSFQAPDTIHSGVTRIRLINDGPDFHHVILARLEDGRTIDDLHHVDHHGPTPAWLKLVGGPNSPGIPGAETNATLDLEPGTYVLLCVIPASDGVPHNLKGMIKPLVVVPSSGPAATLPAADLTMVLDDYSFDTDREITAGRRTIRLENHAAQPHEVVFVKLNEGKNVGDFLAFMQNPAGAPPGMLVGGNTPMATGEVNLVTIDFEAGEYGLICFAPDHQDGAPHIVHGMVKQITVN